MIGDTIDLNVDIGEGFEWDDALLDLASSANVCCGVHAGSAKITELTVEKCLDKGVRIGAHPGYPDRDSMGRAPLDQSHIRPYLDSILNQTRDFVRRYPTAYVKPHGAFYNETGQALGLGWNSLATHPGAKTPYEAGGQELSKTPGTGALIMLLRINRLPLMGMPGTMHEEIASRAKSDFIKEGFADRAYTDDGLLRPRSQPGAILTDRGLVRDQVLKLAAEVDSICVHGDADSSVDFLAFVRQVLMDAGKTICSP